MSQSIRFADFVEINPKVELKRGEEYPFIEMAVVEPGQRYIQVSEHRVYSGGGSKFSSGDVLFARITPCLENGKIIQFDDTDNRNGFGSTEFFIFRAKPKISDPAFVFYLASTDIIRKPAEKSMSGASGRQRADLKSIIDIEIHAPSLPTQRKIAAILSTYDDLIENNIRRIKILEEMAQAIYYEWFIIFRFPGHEDVRMMESELGPVPEGWEVRKLGEVVELLYGKGLKTEDRKEGLIPVYGSSGIIGYHNRALEKGPGIIVGRKGNVGSVYWSDVDFFPIDTVYYVKSKLPLHYIFYNLQKQNFLNNDAAVPGLNRNQAYSLPFLVPDSDTLIEFEKLSDTFFNSIKLLEGKNANLRLTRDLLLPKLISGELDVSGLDIDIPTDL